MTRDIDQVRAGVHERLRDARSEQLKVKHPADDDGLWFFEVEGSDVKVQAESWNGMCPFVVESTASAERLMCSTVDETIEAVVQLLSSRPGSPEPMK